MATEADPSPGEPTRRLDDPHLAAFAPALYVAWADGDLSASEVTALCDRVDEEELDEGCREVLGEWLDPEDPPSARELQALLAAVRRAAADLEGAERRSLAELGEALARAGGLEPGEPERRALGRLEEALGLGGQEAGRRLLAVERPRPEPALPEPSFPAGELAELLASPHAPLRRRLMKLLAAPRVSVERARDLDRAAYRIHVLERCRELASEGYGALGLPAVADGKDDLGAFVAAFETLAHGDLSVLVKFGVQFGLFAGSIAQLGTGEHHRRWLPPAATLELPGCFAMTETGHGSNVQELATVARWDPDAAELVLDTPDRAAWKDYIGNAARDGRVATVFAQLEVGEESHGVHAFVVPIRDEQGELLPGVTVEDCGGKFGLEGVDNGRLAFSGVRLPRRALLDRFASLDADGRYESPIASPTKRFFTMLGTLVGGRISVALAGLAAARSALTIAVRYAERRRQFGPAGAAEVRLLDYPSHQRRLLPPLATTYALHFALRRLAGRYAARPEAEEERREIEARAAGLKALATWHATATIRECREACGGQGYLAENRFAALEADTAVFTTFEGDNTVLLQLVAKSALSGYRKQFSEMDVVGLARYLGSRAATAVAELNPVVTRNTDPDHLRGADFQLAALAWRAEHLLSTAARRLKARIDAGTDSFQALVECQNHVLALARAEVERHLLERFQESIEELDEGPVRDVLVRLRQLHALSSIERDRGWFLEHGYLEGSKAKAIRDQVSELCAELRDDAVGLVDAFEIPDEVLAAPIGRKHPATG